MQSRNTIVTTVLIFLLLSVLLSGCIGEKKATPVQESIHKETVEVSSTNLTLPAGEGNRPEISIASFSSIYMRDNLNNKDQTSYNISEVYYAVYNLSIKNNGSTGLDFKLNDLRLHEGDRIFNATALEHYLRDGSNLLEVLQDLEKENKIQDTTLLPGQSLNGTVAFRVNSLYNKSFLLKYDTTTVTSASFEKSIEALAAAEYFNYSIALGLPPYNLCRESNEMYLFSWDEIPGNDNGKLVEFLGQKYGIYWVKTAKIEKIDDVRTIIVSTEQNSLSLRLNDEKTKVNLKIDDGRTFELNARTENSKLNIYTGTRGSYEPIFDDNCEAWANWVNRSIFEVYKKSDIERMQKSKLIPTTEMVYALRVIPERNITMSPVTKRFDRSHLLVTDDTGDEIINTSRIQGMAVLGNQTYTFKPDWMLNFPGMNIPNASVVQISFKASYTIGETGRLSYINQDVILDDKLNIIVVRYYPIQFHAG